MRRHENGETNEQELGIDITATTKSEQQETPLEVNALNVNEMCFRHPKSKR